MGLATTAPAIPETGRDRVVAVLCHEASAGWSSAVRGRILALDGVEGVLAVDRESGPVLPGLAATVDQALVRGADQVLVAIAPFDAPRDLLSRARRWIADDARFGLICFLSNQAGYLSLDGIDPGRSPEGISTRLRAAGPDLGPVPIAAAEGCVVLLGRSALVAAGGLDPVLDRDPFLSLCEFGLRASRRGFHTALDSQSYVLREPGGLLRTLSSDQDLRRRLHADYPFFPALHDLQATKPDEPLGQALMLARAKTGGLRLALDASTLAHHDPRIRNRFLAVVEAMVAEDRVSWLGLVGSVSPADRRDADIGGKVEFVPPDIEALKRRNIDVLHVPSAHASTQSWWTWRAAVARTVVTLDEAPGPSGASLSGADFIVTHSRRIVSDLERVRAPFPLERIALVPQSTDPDAPTRVPAAVSERGWVAERFILCVTRAMDSRAILAALELQSALQAEEISLRVAVIDHEVDLADRRDEVAIAPKSEKQNLLLTPGVSDPERRWLLNHAEVILATDGVADLADLRQAPAPVLDAHDPETLNTVRNLLRDRTTARRVTGPRTSVSEPKALFQTYLDALGRPPRRI